MSALNRLNFEKGTKRSNYDQVDKALRSSGNNYNGTSTVYMYHTIDTGRNFFRIAPAHLVQTDPPFVAVKYSNLQVLVDVYDEDNRQKTGETERKRRKKYNAKHHGPRKDKHLLINTDPVDYYCEYLFEKAKRECTTQEDKAKFLRHVKGFMGDGGFNWGIEPVVKLICFAWNQKGELKLLELSEAMYRQMEQAAMAATQSDPNADDIWSHVSHGCMLVIEKNITMQTGRRKKTEYKLYQDQPNMQTKETWDEYFERTKITDEQLKELTEKKSLRQMFIENYTMKDYLCVVESLKWFDKEYGYDAFNDPAFVSEFLKIENDIKKHLESNSSEHADVENKKPQASEKVNTNEFSSGIQTSKIAYIVDYVKNKYNTEINLDIAKSEEIDELFEKCLMKLDLDIELLKKQHSWVKGDDEFLQDLHKGKVD